MKSNEKAVWLVHDDAVIIGVVDDFYKLQAQNSVGVRVVMKDNTEVLIPWGNIAVITDATEVENDPLRTSDSLPVA